MEFHLVIEQRHLDPIEAILYDSEMDAKWTAEYRGRLNEEALASAFGVLCARHPVLRARIEPDYEGLLLSRSDGNHPNFVVIDGDRRDLIREACERWDLGQALCRLVVIRGESRGYVLFGMNHAIVDGASYMSMAQELWHLYTDTVNGVAIKSNVVESLPMAPSVLLRERWGDTQDSSSGTETGLPRSGLNASYGFYRHIRFSRQDTAQFAAVARSNRTSLTAVLSGSLATSLQAHAASNRSMSIQLVSLVDLRRFISQRVDATATTYLCGGHVATVTVTPDADPIAVGNEFTTTLKADINRRKLAVTPSATKRSLHDFLVRQAAADVSFNNVGVLSAFRLPVDLEIVDFFLPCPYGDSGLNRKALLPLGAPRCSVAVCTFGGRLSAYFSCRMELEEIVEEFSERLRRLIRS